MLLLAAIIDGDSLEARQAAGGLEAEARCRYGEVNETPARRNVVAEASAAVLVNFLCVRAALCFPLSHILGLLLVKS